LIDLKLLQRHLLYLDCQEKGVLLGLNQDIFEIESRVEKVKGKYIVLIMILLVLVVMGFAYFLLKQITGGDSAQTYEETIINMIQIKDALWGK
jgi:Tfp pilus assembly protein PilO